MGLDSFLVRLIIAVLVYYLGEVLLGLIKDAKLKEILNVVLIIVVVLYAAFGSILPIK